MQFERNAVTLTTGISCSQNKVSVRSDEVDISEADHHGPSSLKLSLESL